MSRFLNDDRIEEELQLLFGLPDDPEVSEDEYEAEPETVTDLDISNILNGFDDPMLRSEVNAQRQNYDSVPLNNLNTEEPSTSSAGDQPLPSSLHLDSNTESSSPVELPLRHDSVLTSSPTPPVANAATMSDTDESDTEEQEWKKVLYPQHPDIDYFDSIHLESTNYIPSRTRPVTYFTYFFDTDVIDLLVEQTNIYAEQNRSHNWSPVDIPEMKAFLGMIILMGLHPLPTIDLYWSSDPFFRVAEIASVMTCKRFKKVLENLHLNDNSKIPPRGAPQFDKLYKVRPLLELLNTACQRSAKTTTSQSIDESMIQFKGISTLKQYMPLKPVKRGYKVWTRADSQTGYVFEFQIYTGKRDDQSTEFGLGANVVKSLTQKLVDEGYRGHVTFDNFFASYDIQQYLYNNGIYATATVNSNRADLPLVVKHAKKKNIPRSQKINLARGEFRWRTKNNVAFVMWQDTKLVTLLTTAFHPKVNKTFCDRTQKDVSKRAFLCPSTVLQYTERMGGVDRFDQKRTTYEVGRRSKRWWLRIFYFCVDLAITNSFLLYSSNTRVHNPLSQLHFRLCLARGLISNYSSRKKSLDRQPQYSAKRPKLSTNRQKEVGVVDEIRLSNVGIHQHEQLNSWRRCRLCSTKTRNKRSKIQCFTCKVPLCVVPCFDLFHSQQV